jgi:hypothetical protein
MDLANTSETCPENVRMIQVMANMSGWNAGARTARASASPWMARKSP